MNSSKVTKWSLQFFTATRKFCCEKCSPSRVIRWVNLPLLPVGTTQKRDCSVVTLPVWESHAIWKIWIAVQNYNHHTNISWAFTMHHTARLEMHIFLSYGSLWCRSYYWYHSTEENIEAGRGLIPCLKSQSSSGLLNSRYLQSQWVPATWCHATFHIASFQSTRGT